MGLKSSVATFEWDNFSYMVIILAPNRSFFFLNQQNIFIWRIWTFIYSFPWAITSERGWSYYLIKEMSKFLRKMETSNLAGLKRQISVDSIHCLAFSILKIWTALFQIESISCPSPGAAAACRLAAQFLTQWELWLLSSCEYQVPKYGFRYLMIETQVWKYGSLVHNQLHT